MERKSDLRCIILINVIILIIFNPVLSQSSFISISKSNKIESVIYLQGYENMTETPAYTIQLVSDQRSYNPDEKVQISIYIIGSGTIEESLIMGRIPENIVSDSITLTLFKFAKSTIGEWEGWKPVFPAEQFEMKYSFHGVLATPYFSHPEGSLILWSESEINDPKSDESYPPISINFKINSNAPAGDHKIELVLKYRFEGVWYISKENVTIHIRSDIERYAILLSAIITVLVGILLTILAWILSNIK
jgi:hypothetical protein